ncbi:helix-turn-helix transcriptional regulator [Halococcus agarilyticus]|uniref:helix-turn-helix transcriptional regulator n=1 Tax=Halococcus agarilyticus TaxID=1232219 RepID=UPI00067821EF|nr:hypothetical protein [Halococcus agarilyticus]
MRWLSALGLAVVVLAGAMVVPLPAVASAQTVNGTGPSGPTDGQNAFNDTQFVVTVYENGSARWTHRYKQPLQNQTEVERFRAYANRFTSEETPLYADFRDRATALTEVGTNATGRSMTARGFSRSARVVPQPASTGVVETSFLWTNFSATTGGEIAIGDVFEGGIYLSSGASVEIRAGPDLSIAWDSVEPAPDASTNGSADGNDSATWFGERQFATGQPRVVFVEQSGVGMNGPPMLDGSMVWLAAALAVAVILGTVVVQRSDRSPFGGSQATAADERPAETATEDAPETSDGPSSAAATEPTVPDEELVSDEEVVRSLLDENGGRMRQSEIVAETDWSKSKVSMLLSEMAETGDLSKLRVGRENIVSLDGHEPEAAGSPFDEE